MRLSFTMWGGRFNPIIPMGNPEGADHLVRQFGVDVLRHPTDQQTVAAFTSRHKNLPWPLFHDEFFPEYRPNLRGPVFVDIRHPVVRIYNEYVRTSRTPEQLLDMYEWAEDDPLADVLLATLGALPPIEDTGVDYAALLQTTLLGARAIIANGQEIPIPHPARYSVATLNREGIDGRYFSGRGWNYAGFYVGEADRFDDLVNFWNLRAADIPVTFLDPRHAARLHARTSQRAQSIRAAPPPEHGPQGVALWHRMERAVDDARPLLGEGGIIDCRLHPEALGVAGVRVPTMYFAESSALASVDKNAKGASVAFALTDKPFLDEGDAYNQHYVLSIDPGIGLFQDETATLHTPFIPELNEFYGRNVHFRWDGARAEPESLGIIEQVSADHVTLRALNVNELICAIFASVGIEATPSKPGLIASTLIQQMGGLHGCRPFKIAGVRALIENHRPDQSFSRATAKQTIRGQGDVRPLSEYQWLYIEPRHGRELTNDAVLSYLLDRGVFRAGLKFDCPSCRLEFWRTLDDARSHIDCEYCGHGFKTSGQLRDKDWAFRRSGLFGNDDHQEGAIPVVLALQQLMHMHSLNEGMFTTAMKLRPRDGAVPECETDFVVVTEAGPDHRIQIVIGEAKTRKPITEDDVSKLSAAASAFPRDKLDVFIAFAKLSPFSVAEIEAIRKINTDAGLRAILLTERELEPSFVYERTAEEFDINKTAVSFQDMATVSARVFFQNLRRNQAPAKDPPAS